MKKNLTLLSVGLFLTACDEVAPKGYFCDFQGRDISSCKKDENPYRLNCDQEKRSVFILNCAKAANPMSDEEGEDLVKQCEDTSKNIFCEKIYL